MRTPLGPDCTARQLTSTDATLRRDPCSGDPYDSHVGRYSPELAAALIAVAGVERGQRALDVGCGSGAVAQALAALLAAESEPS